jgi:glycerophosphoryl diester phosphodiesterase
MAAGSCFFADPSPVAFAHRGGAAEAPENSWAAFGRAVALGFRYMETDVRATADGVPVAIHDRTLWRVTGHPGHVNTTQWRQLQTCPLADGREIPRLDDLLAEWPDLRWNIDVKCAEAVVPVADVLKRTRSQDRVLVTSFSGRRTAAVRAAVAPDLATGASPWTIALLVGAKFAPFARLRPAVTAAQVPVGSKGIRIVDVAFVRTCHRAGIAVHVWTIDDRSEMESLLDLEVDGIMTDRPSLLKEVLEHRGQWS